MKLAPLPYHDWKESRITLHLILQIIGKVRMSLNPRRPHWWHITLYVSPVGFTTSMMPNSKGNGCLELIYNVRNMEVVLVLDSGEEYSIPLSEGLSVANFFSQFKSLLKEQDINTYIKDEAFDIGIEKAYSEIHEYHHHDAKAIHHFWQSMAFTDHVFREFSGMYYGKTSPVQIYWHHLDMAVTRFSGKKLPPMPEETSKLEKDAYSHEVISMGYWAGDDNMQEPAYYAYAYPSPEGLDQEVLQPSYAYWMDANGSPMAIMPYHKLIKEENPREVLLQFLESCYQAAGKRGGWSMEENHVPSLENL